MIHFRPAMKPPLKGSGVFSDVVSHTGQLSLRLCVKSSCESGTQRRGAFEMFQNCLGPAVFCEMGQDRRKYPSCNHILKLYKMHNL